MRDMSQDGMDDKEKGGGTEEMENKMASLGIVEVSKPKTTTAITNERGEKLDKLPPDKTGRGNQKEGLGFKTRMGNQKEGNKVRADRKPHKTTITKMTKKRGKETTRSQKQKDN